MLSPLAAFVDAHRPALARLAASRAHGGTVPTGAREQMPVASTFMVWAPDRAFSGLDRLILVLVGVALEAGQSAGLGQRASIARLAAVIRGAIENPGSEMRVVLSGVESIQGMVGAVDSMLQVDGRVLHEGFRSIWQRWLRGTLIRWMQADPERLAHAIRTPRLLPDAHGPVIEVGGSPEEDAPAAIACDSSVVEPDDGPFRSPGLRRRKALARGMARASGGDLTMPVDQIAPVELVGALARAILLAAEHALASSRPDEAEDFAAIGLALATGTREIDLLDVRWGREAPDRGAAVDPSRPRMYRSACMPPNAVSPGTQLDGWVEVPGRQVDWPLPPRLHRVLLALANDPPLPGSPVLAGRARTLSEADRLTTVMGRLAGANGLSVGQIRLALATHLARKFGPEVAQLTFGDSFSMSVAPSYYASIPVESVFSAVAGIQLHWFGEMADLQGDLSGKTLGSRLVLTDAAARRWPASLRQRIRSASHRAAGGIAAQWRAWRNHLAGALCAATGARPTSWLEQIDLDQIVPEYGLVMLADKASDMLRQTRVAATGRRWISDLRLYLDWLIGRSSDLSDREIAAHAQRVLLSEAPLFSLPDTEGGPLTVAELRRSMPEPLQPFANHYRHRLNAVMQRQGVDPEIRHAQLGWIVTPAHAMADMSPWSAQSFAKTLSPVLDQFLVDDGWYPASQRITQWSWAGVPDRPLRDWASVAREHVADHQREVRQIKTRLVERWKEVADDVGERLGRAISRFFPSLRLDSRTRRLEPAEGFSGARLVEMSAGHHGLLCDAVREGDKDPGDATEAVATRVLLFRLILSARRRGLVIGPLPSRPYLRVTSDPTPFLRGTGLAVRHAEEFRRRLVARASIQRGHDEGPVATLGVLMHAPHRSLALATAAVDAAAGAARSQQRPDCVRVPAVVDRASMPLALGGLPAILVAQRGVRTPSARAPDRHHLATWWRKVMSDGSKQAIDDEELLGRIESLFQAAGRLELSGPERTVMLGDAALAALPIERCLARDDRWPVRTSSRSSGKDVETSTFEHDPGPPADATIPASSAGVERDYTRFTGLLNPAVFASQVEGTSDSHHGWRGKLRRKLSDLRDEVGERTNLGLLVGFTLYRLLYGGQRKARLAHSTLAWVTRFGADLLAVAGSRSILSWDVEAYRSGYLAILAGKPSTARRQAFDALLPFHDYLVAVHQAPELEVDDLARFAGERLAFADPGTLTDAEVRCALDILRSDLAAEVARTDAAPEAIRLLELREVMFLLLEGSGIRPSSAYGLTLSDLVLLEPGRSFVRVRITGGFGQAKSAASQGYIPLEGAVWEGSFARMKEWLDREVHRTGAAALDLPVFGVESGARKRFARDHLTRRIDQLVKWDSAQPKARTYWLRKRRIAARHDRVASMESPMARDVHDVLSTCGHVLIQTPLANYIGDPAIAMAGQFRADRAASRASMLAVTGDVPSALDMAWQRAGKSASARIHVVLQRLGHCEADAPHEQFSPAPTMPRRAVLLPRHVDRYARTLHLCRDRSEAMIASGLTDAQVDLLENCSREYLRDRGIAPWPLQGLAAQRAVMAPPRRLVCAKRVLALLNADPDDRLIALAEAYRQQSHVRQLAGPRSIVALDTDDRRDAAVWLVDAIGDALRIERTGDLYVMRLAESTRDLSVRSALAWVMMVVWIWRRYSAA